MGRSDQSNEEGAARIMIDIEEGATGTLVNIEEGTAMR